MMRAGEYYEKMGKCAFLKVADSIYDRMVKLLDSEDSKFMRTFFLSLPRGEATSRAPSSRFL